MTRALSLRLLGLLLSLMVVLASFSATAKERITYYHNDLLGSAVAATGAEGSLLWQEDYSPYGKRLLKQDEGRNTRWYTGKSEVKALGVQYFDARWYDADLGRFLSIDPVDFNEKDIHSFNRYAYANNSPYRYTDPTGETVFDVVFLAADVVKLGVAVYSGVGVGAAAADVGWSIVGVVSPVPGTGLAIKSAKAARLAKAVDKAQDSSDVVKPIVISRSQFPGSAKHIDDAIASGKSDVLTIDRPNAPANRRDSLRGIETKPGYDRDEFPPAMFKEGGKGASVRHVKSSDNRGAGACIGAQCRGLPNGAKVKIKVVD